MNELLHYRTYESKSSEAPQWPVLLLHGLFGSGDNFHSVAVELSKEYTVIVPDLRNHGRSFHAPDTSYKALAEDVERLLDHLEIDSAVLCGHSMGGKCAMRVACLQPERVVGLIVEDMGPGEHPERYGKEVRYMRDLDTAGLSSRKDAEKKLGEAIGDRMMTLFLLKNLERREEGGYKWRNNLKGIAEGYGEIWKAAVTGDMRYEGPVLFINGGESSAVTQQDRDIIEKRFPDAKTETIAAAGHWVHAEQQKQFLSAVTDFLHERMSGT